MGCHKFRVPPKFVPHIADLEIIPVADPSSVVGLTVSGCRSRQKMLRTFLDKNDWDAALIQGRGHLYYFTGYWCHAALASLALIERGGPTLLVLPVPTDRNLACDETVVYESLRLCTLVDDQPGAALAALGGRLAKFQRIACDVAVFPWLAPQATWGNLQDQILAMRRTKGDDEVALVRQALAATEAAYQYAKDHLAAGVTEVDLFAGMQAAAAAYAGEVLGEFGNDFQIGGTGSAPRRRAAQDGEVAVFDLSVVLRGYHSDMCRSFVVGKNPSAAQEMAHERIMHVLAVIEQMAQPGVRCRQLYQAARSLLEGYCGWSFPHHLGHGIGLNGHEAPRLNPNWDDVLQVGDVIAVEPGLYGPDLKAGLRIEQVYLVGENGLARLTQFPTELV